MWESSEDTTNHARCLLARCKILTKCLYVCLIEDTDDMTELCENVNIFKWFIQEKNVAVLKYFLFVLIAYTVKLFPTSMTHGLNYLILNNPMLWSMRRREIKSWIH